MRKGAVLAAGLVSFAALAEPRLPGMDTELEAWLARRDFMFLWDIDQRTVGRGDPYRRLRTYYDGLIYALTEERRLIEPGTPALVKLDPIPHGERWDEAFAGTLRSSETYLEGEAVVIHTEVTRRDCDRNRAQVFYAVSLKPRDDPAWHAMRARRDTFTCDVAK